MKKKFPLFLIFPAFLLILIISNFVISPVRLFENDQVNTRNRNFAGIMAAKENMDVLVVGDSESYTTFSPLQFWNEHGVPAYNCGVQGQNLIETYSELVTALKTQKPKVLLMETYLLFRYAKPMKCAELMVAEQFYQWFPALRFHSSWRTVFYTESEKAQERDWPKGYHIVTIVAHEENAAREESNPDTVHFSKVNSFYLNRIRKLCEKNDIQLVFYTSPSPMNYSKERIAYLKNYAEKEGIPYINLLEHMEDMKLDLKIDSYDGGDHVNIAGAKKTTSFLGQFLVEECGLTSRKDDPAYAHWDEEAREYKTRIKKMMKKWKKNAEKKPKEQ